MTDHEAIYRLRELLRDIRDAEPRLSARQLLTDDEGIALLEWVECQTHATLSSPEHEIYRKTAQEMYQREGEIEIDDEAFISMSDDPSDPGAHVQAWVWVNPEDVAFATGQRPTPPEAAHRR